MNRPALTPCQQWDPQLLLKAQGVRVLFLDVDGVLTDGGLYFSAEGESLKRFHTLDGHGLKMLQKASITPAVVTGRDSAPLRLRLKQLGIEHARFGTEDKVPAAESILAELGLKWDQAAAMGMIGQICPCCAVAVWPEPRQCSRGSAARSGLGERQKRWRGCCTSIL